MQIFFVPFFFWDKICYNQFVFRFNVCEIMFLRFLLLYFPAAGTASNNAAPPSSNNVVPTTTTNSAEIDLLGSLTDSFSSNALAIMPVTASSATEAELSANSGSVPTFTTQSASSATNQVAKL